MTPNNYTSNSSRNIRKKSNDSKNGRLKISKALIILVTAYKKSSGNTETNMHHGQRSLRNELRKIIEAKR